MLFKFKELTVDIKLEKILSNSKREDITKSQEKFIKYTKIKHHPLNQSRIVLFHLFLILVEIKVQLFLIVVR